MIMKMLAIGLLLLAASETTTGTAAVVSMSMGGFLLYLTCTSITMRLFSKC